MATARYRHDGGYQRDFREGRSDGGLARGARPEDCEISRDHRTSSSRRPDRSHSPLSVRHDSDGGECGRSSSLQFLRATPATGGREADGHHWNEGSGPRTHSLDLDASADGSAETHVGRDGAGADSGDARDAAGNVLLALSAGEHSDYRLRFDRATGRARTTRAGIHSAEPATDGCSDRKGGARFKAVAVLPVLRARVGATAN